MEVDRILYIFGSFNRKKDKRKSPDQSSISAGNSPLRRQASIPPRTSAYEEIKEDRDRHETKQWNCRLCRKELTEPRLLACLHSFCTRCLQGLRQEGEAEVWREPDGGSIQEAGSSGGSAGSGYESDLRHSGSDASWDHKQRKYGIFTRKISGKSVQLIVCPACSQETPLPLGGVSALPLNYVLLRKMNGESRGSVLCDLCNSDNKAESRCNQCLVSVCETCGEAHGRQKSTARHSLEPLGPPPQLCSQHQAELCIYCATCQQVICRDCCVIAHAGHALAGAARAAAERARLLRDACGRARRVPQEAERAARALHLQAQQVDSRAARVEAEVRGWGERYQAAVAAHARALAAAAARARAEYRRRVDAHARALDRRGRRAVEAVELAEELLAGARGLELLALPGAAARLARLARLPPAPAPPALRLAAAARAPHDPALVGRLLTHAADPDRCRLDAEGFQDLRVNCPHEAVLELRDSRGERIWCGGDQVAGYFRRSDSRARPQSARVADRGDGSYRLGLAPDSPGAYFLAVTLNNKPIQGSPFSCAVRAAPPPGRCRCCASPARASSACASPARASPACASSARASPACASPARASPACASPARAACACAGLEPGRCGCGHGPAGRPGARRRSCASPARRGASLYHVSL